MIRPVRTTPVLALAGAALFGLACVGGIGGGTGGDSSGSGPGSNPGGGPGRGGGNSNDPSSPGNGGGGPSSGTNAQDSVGPKPVRRLTNTEYNNTIRDLLGIDAPVITADLGLASDLEAWERGFLEGATVGSANDARIFVELSEKIAAQVMPRIGELLPQGCASPAAGAEEGCAQQFIEQFGLRAFRRPLTDGEKEDLQALYTSIRAPEVGLTFPEAIRTLIGAMLQSPMFTYRWEVGETPTTDGDLVRLSHYEVASQLSYLTLASMPDAELFDAAGAGKLNDPDEIAAQARRLLSSDKAKAGLAEFIVQWLNVTALPSLTKDESFTNYNPEVGQAMLAESGMFFADLMQSQSDGKLEQLFTSSSTYVNGPLAKLYGDTSVTGAEMQKVSLNPEQRAGILTHGSFLAGHSDGDEPHPIHRGLEVLEKVLCTAIVPPADFVPPPVMDVDPSLSNRERFEKSTTSEPSCAACHVRINAVGFAFENYDAVGAWRTTDAGKPVNASGTYPFDGGDASFTNAVEFSHAVAASKEARNCMTKQFLEYALRRPSTSVEKVSIQSMAEAFEKSGYDLKELLVATTKTRAFTHRKPLEGEGQQ